MAEEREKNLVSVSFFFFLEFNGDFCITRKKQPICILCVEENETWQKSSAISDIHGHPSTIRNIFVTAISKPFLLY